ncbi:General alpha-glucoside permease [Tolypocladium ophioglossoides CBS 100239]|uniref:General alpha-glucoside permease n=1 Tax=Tolypocladium ophioglossoides (strain CBS 100239) TaxID=1163406 RepID=A0A0L0NAD6_TOLOC|nr:General alpha-glucoside permease [Tolypocladium ophioglossoides CBS 100239]
MEKRDAATVEAHPSGVEQTIRADHQLEHALTVRDVFRRHPALVFWSVYWSLAATGWGFDAQVNGGMLSVRAFRRDFGYMYGGEPVLPADWQAAFNTVSSVGQFFGGFACSWLADRVGRRAAMLAGVAIVTGGVLGEVFSTANGAFVVSKLILGCGLGFYLTLAPLAASECAPVAFRGVATAGVQFGIGAGQLLSNAVIKAFGEWDSRWAYRAPFAIQLVFPALLLAGLPFAPETPWYLARVGRREEAKRSLRRLYGAAIDVDGKLVALEATIADEEAVRSTQRSLLQCFRGTDRVRTAISTGVFACQHLVGIIFVLGYSTYFFQLAGLPTGKSFDLGVGVTACGLAGFVSSWFFINSLGRRNIFLFGMGLVTAILLLIGVLDVVPTSGAKWVQAGLTVVYAFVYTASLGAMAFAILGEASSTSLRAPTVALATATQAIAGTVFNFVIPYMVNPDQGNLKGKVGFIFGGLALVASAWGFFYVPELKGRTFDEIDRMFQARVPPRKMGSHQLEEDYTYASTAQPAAPRRRHSRLALAGRGLKPNTGDNLTLS